MSDKFKSFDDVECEIWHFKKELKEVQDQARKNKEELKEIQKKLKEE